MADGSPESLASELPDRQMTATIGSAHSEDAQAIEAIENAADVLLAERFLADDWGTAPPGSSRVSSSGFVLMAELMSDEVIGFVHVLEVEGRVHLEQVSVLPDYGRRGVGKLLVEAAIEEATRRGYDQMTLRTYAAVPWNGPFYALLGFAESEPETDFQRSLIDVENGLGLAQYGRRIQMTRFLNTPA